MSVQILVGDVREKLRELADDSVDCVVTSPPYWGLRDYGVPGQIGMERTLGEHIAVLVDVFAEMRRVLKPEAAFWLNYGDCYATTPNGRSAADTKAAGNDDRTFRDKPFSTIGPIYDPKHRPRNARGSHLHGDDTRAHDDRIVAGGYLKPKDLCLIPFRLVIALQESGWWVRSRCVWGKPNGMPDSSGRYRPSVAHEEIFLLSKSGDLAYDFEAVKAPVAESTGPRLANVHNGQGSVRANGGTRKDRPMRAVGTDEGRLLRTYEPEVWHIATAAYADAHFATFPPALVERCLMATCPIGGTVLDPFGGAGTTGLVADRMRRNAILIELNPDYAEQARKRIERDCPMFSHVETAIPLAGSTA